MISIKNQVSETILIGELSGFKYHISKIWKCPEAGYCRKEELKFCEGYLSEVIIDKPNGKELHRKACIARWSLRLPQKGE